MGLLRVALVGCGLISEEHIRAYAQHAERAKITVCCDIDAERAAQRAAQVGDARAVTRYEDILADPEIDAVELCTPHHLHRDAVIAAAQAGKQILCQNPLATTLADCDAMIAAAEEAEVTLFYAEMNRTLPAAVKAREVIAEGRIGQLVGIHASAAYRQGGAYLNTAWRYDAATNGGGQLIDAGIHAIDLMLSIGGQVDAVHCFTALFRPELGQEDTAVASVRFAGGHLGTLFTTESTASWLPLPNCIVYGTEGALTLGGSFGPLTLHRPDLPDRQEALLPNQRSSYDAFPVMIGRYLDTVLNGAENLCPGRIGRENLEFVLAAYESARLGREVKIAEVAAG